MSSKIRRDDWERLFAPDAPRRGGPLRALLNALLVTITLALVSALGVYVVALSNQQRAAQISAATVGAATAAPLETATAAAAVLETATRFAIRTATAEARTTPVANAAPAALGTRQVVRSGNLRTEPRVAPETVVGQLAPGDTLTVLEEQQVNGESWLRVQLTTPGRRSAGGHRAGWQRRLGQRGAAPVIAALIFDFDGTILDTESAELATLTALYTSHSQTLPLDRWLLALGTQSAYDPLADLVALVGPPLDRQTLAASHRPRYLAAISVAELRPGVLALLDHAAANGIALAVASSSGRSWVSGHLARHGLLERFAVIRTREDVAAVKPAPDLFLSAATALGVAPADCVVIEDSPNGLRAAASAGMRVVAAPIPPLAALELPPHTLRLNTLADLPPAALLARLETL